MQFLPAFLLLGLVLLCRGLPLDNAAASDAELAQDDALDSEPADDLKLREKRTIFPFVVGETILDIQCRRGSITVCAPDGPCGCPVGYSSQTNVGVCGFATLNHFLNTTNIAGTCCYKSASSVVVPLTTTGPSILLPQIVAYPVYAQYPYALGNQSGPATPAPYNNNNNGYGNSGGSNGYGNSVSYGKK